MFSKKLKIIGLVIVAITLLILTLVNIFSTRKAEKTQGGSAIAELSDGILITDYSTNGTATTSPYTFTVPLGASGWRTASFQVEGMANATVVIHGSNDSLVSSTDRFGANGARSSSTRTFLNITNDLIGAANFSSDKMVFLDTPIILQWIRFVVTTSTSATSTIRIKGSFSSQ